MLCDGGQVGELVEAAAAEGGGEAAPAQSRTIEGTWRLRWSAQVLSRACVSILCMLVVNWSISTTLLCSWNSHCCVQEELSTSGCSAIDRGAKCQPGLLIVLPAEKPSPGANLVPNLNLPFHCAVQAPNANALQRLAGRGARSVQVVGGSSGPGRLENRLELLPGLRVRACAACAPQGRRRTRVAIDDVFLELFGLRCATRNPPPALWLAAVAHRCAARLASGDQRTGAGRPTA